MERQFGPPPGDHAWWVGLGGILPLLLFAVLIGVLIWAVLKLSREGPGRSAPQWAGPVRAITPDAALEHVRHRYARGEIDRAEFMRISQDLGAPISAMPPPPAAAAPEEPGT
jgi:uncharacterized membrane protein